MITDWFLGLLFGLVDGAVALLPAGQPLTTGGFSFVNDVNYFLPISEMFNLFLMVFMFGAPLGLVSLVVWVLVGVVRGGATKA